MRAEAASLGLAARTTCGRRSRARRSAPRPRPGARPASIVWYEAHRRAQSIRTRGIGTMNARPGGGTRPAARGSRRRSSTSAAARSRAGLRATAPARGSAGACRACTAPACPCCGRRRSRAVRADAEVVQQRAALGRRAVGGDSRASRLQAAQRGISSSRSAIDALGRSPGRLRASEHAPGRSSASSAATAGAGGGLPATWRRTNSRSEPPWIGSARRRRPPARARRTARRARSARSSRGARGRSCRTRSGRSCP